MRAACLVRIQAAIWFVEQVLTENRGFVFIANPDFLPSRQQRILGAIGVVVQGGPLGGGKGFNIVNHQFKDGLQANFPGHVNHAVQSLEMGGILLFAGSATNPSEHHPDDHEIGTHPYRAAVVILCIVDIA